MGTCCWTMCRECEIEAPQVGDFGYLGYPTLEETAPDSDATTFGAIFRGLDGIHAVTEEVEEFRRFLERHAGHRIVTENEDGVVFGEANATWDPDTQPIDLGDIVAATTAVTAETSVDDEDELEEDLLGDEDDDDVPGVYLKARYRVACATCQQAVTTSDLYPFSPFAPKRLSRDAMLAFQQQVIPALEKDCYSAEPLYAGDIARLDSFFEAHRDHEVLAELTTALTD